MRELSVPNQLFPESIKKLIDFGFLSIPRTHQPVAGSTHEIMEMPAARVQPSGDDRGELGEDGIHLWVGRECDVESFTEGAGEFLRHRVGVSSMFEPGAIFEDADPLGTQKTHLGRELSGLFATVVEFVGEFGAEKDDGLTGVHAIFGAPETEHIDAGTPREVGGGDSVSLLEGSRRVGEAGTIHVHREIIFSSDGGEGRNLVATVNGAPLRGLSEGKHPRFRVMNIGALEDDLFDRFGGEFPIGPAGGEDLGAVGKEFGRAAFVGLDVGELMADHAVVALTEGGEREGIGGGAVKHEEDLGVGFLEYFANEITGANRPVIIAVGGQLSLVCRGERGPSFGANAGSIVAGEEVGLEIGWHGRQSGNERWEQMKILRFGKSQRRLLGAGAALLQSCPCQNSNQICISLASWARAKRPSVARRLID